MKRTLILLAGYPGTGKTFLGKKIQEKFKNIGWISSDEIRESLWDKYGFNSLDEKEDLVTKSWEIYYQNLKKLLQSQSVISDYPFSDKQKRQLIEIADAVKANVITIRLIGNLDILYERLTERDLDEKRHLGHIVSAYHKGMEINRVQADYLLSKEEFINRCLNRGYQSFSIGDCLEVDVSDFSFINYDEILSWVSLKLFDMNTSKLYN